MKTLAIAILCVIGSSSALAGSFENHERKLSPPSRVIVSNESRGAPYINNARVEVNHYEPKHDRCSRSDWRSHSANRRHHEHHNHWDPRHFHQFDSRFQHVKHGSSAAYGGVFRPVIVSHVD